MNINEMFSNNCFADLDECQQQPATCSQDCANTDGSYTCSCTSGYQLADEDPDSCVQRPGKITRVGFRKFEPEPLYENY